MRYVVLPLLVLLAACSKTEVVAAIPVKDINQAVALCEPNGGLVWAKLTRTCDRRGCKWQYWVEAQCHNGVTLTKRSQVVETP